MMIRKFIYIISFFSILCAASCSREEVISGVQNGDATIRFKVNLSYAGNSGDAYTKGGIVANQSLYENKINSMTVLVFRAGRFVQAIEGNALNSSAISTDFTITTRSGLEPVKFYLLGNTAYTLEYLTNALYNKTPDEVKSILTAQNVTVNSHGVSSGFPFWGELDRPGGLPASTAGAPTSISGIKMLRATARAMISKTVDDAVFMITSAKIYRMKDKVSVIPSAVNTDMDVSAPTVPAAAGVLAPVSCDASTLPLGYYLTESEASATLNASVTEATCIIIGGRFAGSTIDTYYRIDFEDKSSGSLKVGQILRNHSYSFDIVSVSAPGWETPDDAANNSPAGMKVEVQDWEESESETFQNKEYTLTLSSREVSLSGTEGSSSYIILTTDADTPALSWTEGQNDGPHIENEFFDVNLVKTGTQYRINVKAKKSNKSMQIVEYFYLKASNLSVKLKIKQEIAVFLNAKSNFMWIVSDGSKQQLNEISSSHSWRVVSHEPWINTSISGNKISVWGSPNNNVVQEYRTGVIELANDGGAHCYISIKQVRWVEWTKAYVKGGDCFKGDYNNYLFFSLGEGKTFHTFSTQPTTLGLAAELTENVAVLKSWEQGQAQPDNYDMKGDFYNYEQAVAACTQLQANGRNWKLPSHDEAVDHLMRRVESTTGGAPYVYNPDGSRNFMPNNSNRIFGSRCIDFHMHVFTPDRILYLSNGTYSTYDYYISAILIGNDGQQYPLRCVRNYN